MRAKRLLLLLLVMMCTGCAIHRAQLTVACASTPTSVFPGEPVTATATVGSQNSKENVIVNITGDGVSSSGATATVNTAFLTPGEHTITCNAKEGTTGREGEKPWQVAVPSTASFTVKEFEPPSIGCSVNPASVEPGGTATITTAATSPQNLRLTYTYSASAGSISGSGPSATFSSIGAPPGPVEIACDVSDDAGHHATSYRTVIVAALPPPAAPPQLELPPFPWPPPQASARVTVPLIPGRGEHVVGDIDRRILSALDAMGYVERAHYWVPDGYALITRVEQIERNGRPRAMPYRFSAQLPPPDSLKDYFAGLFTSPPGYFRIIVFVVTDLSFNDTAAPLGEAEATGLLQRGPAALPPVIADQPLPLKTKCTALIYEYQKSSVDTGSAAVPIQSTVDAVTHLRQAGLWQLLSAH